MTLNCHGTNIYISQVLKSGNKTLGFIRRNLSKCNQNTKKRAYETLVRPKLEYASAVWDLHQKNHIHSLEMVQRRAARFVTGYYQRQASVTDMLNQLQWPTLAVRREYIRLVIFYKIIHNSIAILIPSYILPSTRTSRHQHPGSFITISGTTTTYITILLQYRFYTIL